jgi:hypothetical protein
MMPPVEPVRGIIDREKRPAMPRLKTQGNDKNKKDELKSANHRRILTDMDLDNMAD